MVHTPFAVVPRRSPGRYASILSTRSLQAEKGEDGSEEAGEAVAGVGDLAGAVGDLAKDDLEVDDDGELSNEGEGEVDNRGGNGDDQAEAEVELGADDGEDFNIEDDEGLEADVNVGDQGLDADNQVEDDLEVGSNDDIGVDDEAIEGGDTALEDLEVALEVDDDLEEGLSVDLAGTNDSGNFVEVGVDLGLDVEDSGHKGLDDNDDITSTGADLITTGVDLIDIGRREVLDGGLDAIGVARGGQVDVGDLDAGLVAAAARAGSRDGAGLKDGGGHGRANGEGGESGAEELHFDGWRIKR
jgi:hypothetical protein